MGFVETVLGEFGHLVKDSFGFFGVDAQPFGTCQEGVFLAVHLLGIFLPHGTAQQVCLTQGIAGQGTRNLHDLFLVDDNSIGVLQDRFQFRQIVHHLLAAMLTFNKIIHHAASKRAGTIKGAGRDDVLETGWFELDQHILDAAGFQLEYPGGVTGRDQIVAGLVVVPQGGDIEFRHFYPHQFNGVFNDGQVFEPQKVELHQADEFDIFHRVLSVDRAGFLILVERQKFFQLIRRDYDSGGVG